jgi:tetratricopeptide (TPR) repeat protein
VLAETTRYAALASRDEEAVAVGNEALAMADRFGLDVVRAYALLYMGAAEVSLGEPQGFRALERSVEVFEALNSPEAARAYNNLASTLIGVGELRQAIDVYKRGIASTERLGDSGTSQWLRFWGTLTPAYLRGEWDDAYRAADEELQLPPSYYHVGAYDFRARIRVARGEIAEALADARSSLALGRQTSDPQALIPALSIAVAILVAVGLADEASALADELISHDALKRPTPHFASPWFDLSWALVDLGRTDDLAAAVGQVSLPTRWVEAAAATAEGDYLRAAEVYAAAGNPPAETYTRLRAARAGLPDAGLDSAIAFFRKAGATAYLAEAEELATGFRAAPARARSTRRAP